MKKILVILAAVFISSCQGDKKETIVADNVIKGGTIQSSLLTRHNCGCSSLDRVKSYSEGPRFQNHNNIGNDSEWKKYSSDSLRLTARAIWLYNYDTIPNKFGVFKNIEKITLSTRNGIKGLDIFPNLKEVEFFGSIIKIDTAENWLKRIEIFIAAKTKVLQLKSFRSLPNLVQIKIGFSGFDIFPSDIESLDCLTELEFEAYMFGHLDLNTIDLTKFKCLKSAKFGTWYESLTGIPKGLSDTTKIIELQVSHKKMTKEEKAKVKIYNDRFKKASH